MNDYQRIETAIHYLQAHFREQPDLDAVARQVHLSPFHFQRMFTEWAGVSPKKFLQYITVEYAKKLLSEKHSLADASFEAGLSGSSRLHDLFITLEGMTPGDFKKAGRNLFINYSFAETRFGDVLIASTDIGICHMGFADSPEAAFETLQNLFPEAAWHRKTDLLQQQALQVLRGDWTNLPQIKLHLKASPFQLKVWQTLLKIPPGAATHYGAIARAIGSPGASRAVGTAIGQNPVAFLIPCHRVIQSSGVLGQYHWGAGRKTVILGWEAAQRNMAG